MLPTPIQEQQDILDFVQNESANIAIVARAGTGKSTTLEMIANVIPPSKRVLCLAFNKIIADELRQRLPAHCEAKTLNALGHRALGRYFPAWPKIDRDKMYNIIREIPGKVDEFSEVLRACRAAKSVGCVPGGHKRLKSLCTPQEFFENYDYDLSGNDQQVVMEALTISNELVFAEQIIDFDDQIMISTLFPSISFDKYDVVLVDEAQDLSSLNHAMLKKVAKGKARVIVVGDPLQAIYAFRGAHVNSFNLLRDAFECQEFPLCTTFRCAKSIVKHVDWIAPDMVAFEGNPEGQVIDVGEDWELKDIPLDSAIVCRRNAPLFRLSLDFFRADINAEYVGNDIISRMEKILKGIKNNRARKLEVEAYIKHYAETNAKKWKDPEVAKDMVQCLEIVCERFDTLQEMLTWLRSQTRKKARIKLLTVHKAKGLEFDTTFILNKFYFSEEGQELNIQYVAMTRAKNTLVYID